MSDTSTDPRRDRARVGVTGHQRREGIDWDWTRRELERALASLPEPPLGISSLAVGADQLFADTVLELGGDLLTIVPGSWYETCFDGEELAKYRALLQRGSKVVLSGAGGEEAFLAAGIEVADRSDLLMAVWDGQPAEGKGGTADIVEHAVRSGTPVLHLDPIRRMVGRR